jgi:hypothetical protein
MEAEFTNEQELLDNVLVVDAISPAELESVLRNGYRDWTNTPKEPVTKLNEENRVNLPSLPYDS